MQRLTALRAKLANLSVDIASSRPTVKDSARVEASLFEDATPTSSNSTGAAAAVVSDVVVRHGSAFNSERATGMNKLQQLQFVAMMKGMILDEASSLYLTQTNFRVVTARKLRVCPASPNSFCNASVHVATLVAGATAVVLQGKESEFLADAVEDLWEKVLGKMGVVAGSLDADEKAVAVTKWRGRSQAMRMRC